MLFSRGLIYIETVDWFTRLLEEDMDGARVQYKSTLLELFNKYFFEFLELTW